MAALLSDRERLAGVAGDARVPVKSGMVELCPREVRYSEPSGSRLSATRSRAERRFNDLHKPRRLLRWCVSGGGLVIFEPVAACSAADERGWDLDAAGDAVAGRDDGYWVGAHDPDEVSRRAWVGEIRVGPVAGVGDRPGL